MITNLSKKNIIAVSIATTLSLGITANSHAGALSFSNLSISGTRIDNSAGKQYDLSDFTALSIGNSGSDTTSLNNAAATSNILGPVTGNVALPGVCQGMGCPGDDIYTPQVAVTTPNPVVPMSGINFGRSDADVTGAIITGTPVGTSALSNQVSEVELNQTGTGNGATTTGTGTQFTFQLASADSITFNAIASGTTQAALAADAISGLSTSGFSFSISIRDLGTLVAPTDLLIYTFQPAELNANSNLSLGSPGSVEYRLGPTHFSSLGNNTSPILNSTDRYIMTIDTHTQASSRVVEAVIVKKVVASLQAACFPKSG